MSTSTDFLGLSRLERLGRGGQKSSTFTITHLCDYCGGIVGKISYTIFPHMLITQRRGMIKQSGKEVQARQSFRH